MTEIDGSGFAATDLRGRAPAQSLIARLRQEISGARGYLPSGFPSNARSWYAGILGELEVAGVLDDLPAGWLVLHSVPVGEDGTDIDHVVVSPGGRVFTINTKHHAGKRIWVGEHAVFVGGNQTDYLPKARAEAAQAANRLGRGTGRVVSVVPVLVFVGTRPLSIKQLPPGVAIATPRNLVQLLQAAGYAGTPEHGDAVKRAAVTSTTWSSTRLDPARSAELLVWFLSVREAARPAAGVVRPRDGGRSPASRAGGSYRGPSQARKGPHPLKVLGIVLGAIVGSFWAFGMILGLLAAAVAAHGG